MRVVIKCYSLYVINWQPLLIIIIIMNISQVLFHKFLFPEGWSTFYTNIIYSKFICITLYYNYVI